MNKFLRKRFEVGKKGLNNSLSNFIWLNDTVFVINETRVLKTTFMSFTHSQRKVIEPKRVIIQCNLC